MSKIGNFFKSMFTPSSVGNIAFGAGDSLLGSLFNIGAARRQDYYQRRQMSIANDYANQMFDRQVDFWNMQNEYNSPAQQMSRLEAAGLNPNLVYGNGSMANTSNSGMPSVSVPSNSGPTVRPASISMRQAYMDSIMGDTYRAQQNRLVEDAKLSREQQAKARAETLLTLSNVDARKLSNKLFRDTFNEQVESARLGNEQSRRNIEMTTASAEVARKRLDELDAIIAEKGAHIRNLDMNTRLSRANSYLQELTSDYFKETGFLPGSSDIMQWINLISNAFGTSPKSVARGFGSQVRSLFSGKLPSGKLSGFERMLNSLGWKQNE